jgi:hypothetical protein
MLDWRNQRGRTCVLLVEERFSFIQWNGFYKDKERIADAVYRLLRIVFAELRAVTCY